MPALQWRFSKLGLRRSTLHSVKLSVQLPLLLIDLFLLLAQFEQLLFQCLLLLQLLKLLL